MAHTKRLLSDSVSIAGRFTRSVSLAKDWDRPDALDGYILTPTGREILSRFADSIRGESSTRAWSIVGPYGGGKSSFELFVAKLLAGNDAVSASARQILKREDDALHKRLYSGDSPLASDLLLCPVLVNGTRRGLEGAMAQALGEAVTRFSSGEKAASLAKKLANFTAGKGKLGVDALIGCFEKAVEIVCHHKVGGFGLLVVVDELGKHLEFAVQNPDDGDVFVLQALAEFATRSERPILFVTTLHQSLELYAEHVSKARRQEWSKVQGRFEEVAFDEPSEQMIRLVRKAITVKSSEAELASEGRRLAQESWDLELARQSFAKKEYIDLFGHTAPLHPTVVATLGTLFRRIAQNERSLFAFLSSGEPYGFQEFLRTPLEGPTKVATYRLDQLYDYVSTALGASLYTEFRGKQWAEIRSVLDRLRTATPVEVRLAKIIGLMQALGYNAGIKVSDDFLQFALEGEQVSPKAIAAGIESLKQRSVIVYRRHADSYALWEGSDVDIDLRLKDAQRALSQTGTSLISYLAEHGPQRPLVARRHSYRTGTLRFFNVTFADRLNLKTVLATHPADADGHLIYCVAHSRDDLKVLHALLQEHGKGSVPMVAAIPSNAAELQDACHELECLQWIEKHTPELQSDASARRELRARLVDARVRLAQRLHATFHVSQAETHGCKWYYAGSPIEIRSIRSLNEKLSEICDEVFPHTPVWRNELVNRRRLSSSAAKARRNLVEAMIDHGGEDNLGITGTPPERCIYDCLLRSTTLHRKVNDRWGFFPPTKVAGSALQKIWEATDHFLAESEKEKRSVPELFATLRGAPFGLKDGVLPIFLTAVLLHFNSEIALYESGTFVHTLTTARVERLIQSPELFTFQRCRVSGPRAAVYERYAELLLKEGADRPDSPQLLSVLRPLHRFVRQLPDYTTTTRDVSDVASRVLRTILDAREPDQLLFTELPEACGYAPFEPNGRVKKDRMEQFFTTLQQALADLQHAHTRLLMTIERLMYSAFQLEPILSQARHELEHRSRLISDLAVEPKLKVFLGRAMDKATDDELWREAIAAHLAEKPTRKWTDDDRVRFEANLSLTSRLFRHFEALAYEVERTGTALLDGDARAIRVGITVPHEPELERVVRVPLRLNEKAESMRKAIRTLISRPGFENEPEAIVAILAELSRELLASPVSKPKKGN